MGLLPAATLLLALLGPAAGLLCSWEECRCSLLPPRGLLHAACTFHKRQRLELEASDVPESLCSAEITGGKDLRFGAGTLSRLGALERVTVRNFTKVYVQKGSFANLTASGGRTVRFEFLDASSLVLEEHSFRSLRVPVSALVARIAQVIIQRAAFSWLADLTISTVPKLELLDEALVLETPKQSDVDVPSTTITLENVHMEILQKSTFHSPLKLVRIVGSDIGRVRADAFSSMYLRTIVLENSTIHTVESEAFSSRTLIDSLKMTNVKIHEISPNAVLSGLNNLAIDHSKLGVVHTGGINITVAAVTMNNNVLNRVYRKGFNFKDWNNISIRNNTFKWLDREAFSGPFLMEQDRPVSAPEFNFTGNSLQDVGHNSFDFDLTEELLVEVEGNYFNMPCHCNMREYARRLVTGLEGVRDSAFESGLCSVDRSLSQCFHLAVGWRNMWNFTEAVCQAGEQILCEEVQRDAAAPPGPPSVVSAVDRVAGDSGDRERRVLGSIFAIAVCGMLLMMAMSGSMWLSRKGYCTKARLLLPPSTASLSALLARAFSGGGATPTGSAHSISRLSVHEYAELQRKAEEANPEEDVPLEDKATQTLPEELTQELLQSLREKLDDPDNYKEARDMIEHLYDLIKVEESCNRNDHNDSTSIDLEDLDREGAENVYDVIQPGRKRSDPSARVGRNYVSTGTRAPSPDKLLPAYGETKPAVVCEYTEPKDRRVHLYTEPGAGGGPAGAGGPGLLCDYGEPRDSAAHLYAELPPQPPPPPPAIANRPLPSKPQDRPSTSK